MSSASSNGDELRLPRKRPRTSASSEALSTGSFARQLAAAEHEMTSAQLYDPDLDPWAYSLKQLEVIKEHSSEENLALVPEELWDRTSWQSTAGRYIHSSGLAKLVERCAVTLESEYIRLESAHLVPARRKRFGDATVSRGQLDIDVLRQARVVPEHAHVNSQVNRILLSRTLSHELDNRLIDFFPDQDQVIARLLCEIKFQEQRLAATSSGGAQGKASVNPPVRPPFELFYAAAEKAGACFRLVASNRRELRTIVRYEDLEPTVYALEGITQDDPLWLLLFGSKKPLLDKPILPPLVAPVSTNLLIWAMCNRVQRSPPAPASLRKESSLLVRFIDLLFEFWFLSDCTPEADASQLVLRARALFKDHGGPEWEQQLANLEAVDFTDILHAVTLPDDALHSQDPPPTPEERALMLEAAAAAREADEDGDDDLPSLDFADSDLPSDFAALPSHPLTAAALQRFESQQSETASLRSESSRS